MSSQGKISFASATPVVSTAPRVEGTGNSLRYEFRSFDDLLACLEEGTFVFDVAVQEGPKFAEDGRLNLFLKGKYSDHAFGSVYCALKQDTLVEKANQGSSTTSLHYSLLEGNAPDYSKRKAHEDTVETYSAIMRFLEAPFSEVRAKYYPLHGESLHLPRVLKFKTPKGAASRTFSKAGEVVKTAEFDMLSHIRAPGRLLVRLNLPWLLDQRHIQNVMMGLSLTLARWKFMTDSEKAKVAAEKAKVKRSREEESAAPILSTGPARNPSGKKVRHEPVQHAAEDSETEVDA